MEGNRQESGDEFFQEAGLFLGHSRIQAEEGGAEEAQRRNSVESINIVLKKSPFDIFTRKRESAHL